MREAVSSGSCTQIDREKGALDRGNKKMSSGDAGDAGDAGVPQDRFDRLFKEAHDRRERRERRAKLSRFTFKPTLVSSLNGNGNIQTDRINDDRGLRRRQCLGRCGKSALPPG